MRACVYMFIESEINECTRTVTETFGDLFGDDYSSMPRKTRAGWEKETQRDQTITWRQWGSPEVTVP